MASCITFIARVCVCVQGRRVPGSILAFMGPFDVRVSPYL